MRTVAPFVIVVGATGCVSPPGRLCREIDDARAAARHDCPEDAKGPIDVADCAAALSTACSEDEVDRVLAEVECETDYCEDTPSEADCRAEVDEQWPDLTSRCLDAILEL